MARVFPRLLPCFSAFAAGVLAVISSFPATAADLPTAAVFLDASRSQEPALAREVATSVEKAGYVVKFIDSAALGDSKGLASAGFDLLVLPAARELPPSAVDSLRTFLSSGGKLIALGLPAWQESSAAGAAPRLDTLSPTTQFFPIHGAATIGTPEALALAAPLKMTWQGSDPLQAMQPRPQGVGFDQQRPWRWQPLLEARANDGDYRGAIATLVVHLHDSFKGGVWASFTPSDLAFYQKPEIRRLLRETATSLRRGVFLEEGGSEFFTVFENQTFRLGARAVNLGKAVQSNLRIRLRVHARNGGKDLFSREWPLRLEPGEGKSVGESWLPSRWPEGGMSVVVELLDGRKVIDRIEHELNVWKPNPKPEFIIIRDGQFWLDGKPWKAHGVNYMPSSGISTDNGEYYEVWLGKGAYDPAVIDRDLRRIRAMNLNAVSIFVYHKSLKSQNLLDFLRRCAELGLHVNQSLRPGTPLDFHWEEMKELIEFYRMAENDTIFAYDLAWEPHHEQEQLSYGKDWLDWVRNKYGSIDNAAKTWGVPAPLPEGATPVADKGLLGVPSHDQMTRDGEWRKLAADYRCFLDDELRRHYGEARRLVKSIDPHHAVSFRMANTGDPTYQQKWYLPYDFYGLADAVDIWEPEAYGRIGDWNQVRDGRFEADYARLCDAQKPYVWAEMGYSVWDPRQLEASPRKLEFQARYFHDFYRLMRETGADGIFYWWYAGGLRLNENSDFGIINPDGTDRPVTKVIREEAASFFAAPKPPAPDSFVVVDRDQDARGMVGMYEAVKGEYWSAVAAGKTPGLKWKTKPGGAAP